MVNINKLKAKIVENGMNIEELAKNLSIDKGTLYRRLNKKGENFTIKEATKLVDVLKLTPEEANKIFFA